MQKTYFVDFRWAEAWTFAIIYQVWVWEESTGLASYNDKQQRISGILSMIVIKFEFDKQPCILLHAVLRVVL